MEPLKAALRAAATAAVADHDTPNNPTIDAAAAADEHEHLRRLQAAKAARHPSHAVIPPLLTRKRPPSTTTSKHSQSQTHPESAEREQEELRRRFRGLARQRHLREREARLLDAQGLADLSLLLQAVHSPPPPSAAEQEQQQQYQQQVGRCNYDAFCQLRTKAPPAARGYFTVENFLKCARDRHGRINTADFFRHVYNDLCLERTTNTLHFYDQEGHGYLREADLETYVYDLIGSLPALQALPDAFFSFYVFTAVRRFMFFLDPKRTGRIAINHIVESRVMEELMELAMMGPPAPAPQAPPPPPTDEGGAAVAAGAAGAEAPEALWVRQQRAKNWFSAENALRVYNLYLDLDEDHNGLLSKRELLNYSGPFQNMRLTQAFIDRLYEESVTYKLAPEEDPAAAPAAGGGQGPGQQAATGAKKKVEAEMDYKVFLNFVLAMENRSTTPALKWFFKLLDVHKTGALDPFAVRYFFREIGRALEEYGFEAPDTTAIQAEIYDMARCRDPSKGITWEELRGSGVGHIVVLMLVDVHGFLNYDQRENAAASQAAAAAAEEEAALAAAQQAQAAQAVAADSETVVTDDWGGEDAGALQQGGVGSAEGGDGGDSEEGGFERQEEEEGEEEAEEAEGEEEN